MTKFTPSQPTCEDILPSWCQRRIMNIIRFHHRNDMANQSVYKYWRKSIACISMTENYLSILSLTKGIHFSICVYTAV